MRFLAYLLILSASANTLAESTNCADKYSLYSQAQITWQNSSAERAITLLPEQSKRINYYRDTQLLAIERRSLAVKLALEHTPEKVQTWGSLNNWIDLSPELEKELSQHSPQLSALSIKFKNMTEQPEVESDPNFHRTFQKTVLGDSTFRQLMDNFNIRSREINSIACQN